MRTNIERLENIASALIEMEAMKAENQFREHRGETIAYSYEEISSLIDKYLRSREIIK